MCYVLIRVDVTYKYDVPGNAPEMIYGTGDEFHEVLGNHVYTELHYKQIAALIEDVES